MTVDSSSTRLNGIAPGVVYRDKHARSCTCTCLEVRAPSRTLENINLWLPCVDVTSL
jgi:hypothetical protein